MAVTLIPDLNITICDTEDVNDVFGLLEDDNESYLADDREVINSAGRQKFQDVSIADIDASLIQERNYYYKLNENRQNLTANVIRDEFSDSGKNFDNLYAKVESRYRMFKATTDSEKPRHKAAIVIQKSWRKYLFRGIFRRIRDTLIKYSDNNSSAILRLVNPREADLMDRASGTFIRFRLAGETFPPIMVYKIFTKRPIVDLCRSNYYPVDIFNSYNRSNNSLTTGENIFHSKITTVEKNDSEAKLSDEEQKIMNFHDQRYERVDRNDWRPFLSSFLKKPQIFAVATKNKYITSLTRAAMRKRRLKLQLIKRVYEYGRRKEREQETEVAHR